MAIGRVVNLRTRRASAGNPSGKASRAVSYTHLDVYKRQVSHCSAWPRSRHGISRSSNVHRRASGSNRRSLNWLPLPRLANGRNRHARSVARRITSACSTRSQIYDAADRRRFWNFGALPRKRAWRHSGRSRSRLRTHGRSGKSSVPRRFGNRRGGTCARIEKCRSVGHQPPKQPTRNSHA